MTKAETEVHTTRSVFIFIYYYLMLHWIIIIIIKLANTPTLTRKNTLFFKIYSWAGRSIKT
jgi:hypothetical protein